MTTARRIRTTDTVNTASSERFLSSAEFDRSCPARQWLVSSVLLADQPAVLAGPAKCLKTSLALDLAIGLGTGTSFLGHFAVPQCRRVAFLSGECSQATLQETAKQIAAARKVRLKEAQVVWSFELPRLWRAADLRQLHDDLRTWEVNVVIIDPLYLCLLGGRNPPHASNLFEVGPLLYRATRVCLSAGATPVFIYPSVKWIKEGAKQPLGLDQLAFAGMAEFSRQWLLVSRQEAYQPGSGTHRLLLSVGGSLGYSSTWNVRVTEGVLRSATCRKQWEVQVTECTPPARSTRPTREPCSEVPPE